MHVIECVDAWAAQALATWLGGDACGIIVEGATVEVPPSSARAIVALALRAVHSRWVTVDNATALIDTLDLGEEAADASERQVASLANHLDGCRLAASMCRPCSGVGVAWGRVPAARQLITAHGKYTNVDVAQLMVGVAVMHCQCSRPAVRSVGHPTMGSVPLCERCAEEQERRNLR